MHKCLNAQRVHRDAFYENNADVIDQRATRANRLEIICIFSFSCTKRKGLPVHCVIVFYAFVITTVIFVWLFYSNIKYDFW